MISRESLDFIYGKSYCVLIVCKNIAVIALLLHPSERTTEAVHRESASNRQTSNKDCQGFVGKSHARSTHTVAPINIEDEVIVGAWI